MDWLLQFLPADHPIRSTKLFKMSFDVPTAEMVECHIWAPGDIVKVTGVPPYIFSLIESSQKSKETNNLPEITAHLLVQKLEQKGSRLKNITMKQMKAMMTDVVREILEKGHDSRGAQKQQQQAQAVTINKRRASKPSSKDFKLPRGTLQTAWISYCCWDEQGTKPPLRTLFAKEVKGGFSPLFVKYKNLMESIVSEAMEQGIWTEPKDEKAATDLLSKVDLSEVFHIKTRSQRSRLDRLDWESLANRLFPPKESSEASVTQDEDDDSPESSHTEEEWSITDASTEDLTDDDK